MPTSPAATSQKSISRHEQLCLAGAILFGAILRLSFPGRMAIEHFDEGVYASNFWFDAQAGYAYPARHLYAPPLLPAAIEWTMVLSSLCGIRPTGFIPMIPCLIAGLATIPSIWWVGRRWFGPTAGIVSAWLVAASDFHATYSRAALTDVPVCLFLLWGVYFLSQGMQSGSRRDVALAGAFTGMAWWTKYNGWLPLAIGLSGGIAWRLSLPPAERQLATVGKRWLLAAALSFLIWSPVLIGLQNEGGYSAVAANHRQYVGGLKNWRSAAIRQLTLVGLYDNWIGVVYETGTAGVANRTAPQDRPAAPSHQAIDLLDDGWRELQGKWSVVNTISRAIPPWYLIVATPAAMLVLSLIACATCISRRSPRSKSGAWFVLAWLCGLSFATPFYHPYPRLALPWLIAVWLGMGLAVDLVVMSGRQPASLPAVDGNPWRLRWCEVAIAIWLVLCTTIRCSIGTQSAWHDRGGLFRAAESIASLVKEQTSSAGYPGDEAVVYVIGEPAIFFALKGSGLPLVGPVQDLGFLTRPQSRPTYLVRGDRALRSEAFRTEWDAHSNAFAAMKSQSVHASNLVQFDQPDEFARLSHDLRIGETVRLFRVR